MEPHPMSNIKIALVAVVTFGLLSGAAYAKTTVVAKISTPVAEATDVIATSAAAGISVWACAGDSCQIQHASALSARACRALAHKLGPVVSFGDLSAEDLARCISDVSAAQTSVAQR